MKFLLLFVSLYSLVFGYDEANIVFAGDAMMHQKQIDCARQSDNTYDYSDYFTDIAPYISGADYAVVNLETAVSAPPYSGYPCFNAPESYVDALQNAGFDLFLTANNHTLDRNDADYVRPPTISTAAASIISALTGQLPSATQSYLSCAASII